MTFEKESGDPIVEREHEHFTSIWASLAAGAAARDAVIAGWHASYVEAYQRGRRRRARAERASSSRSTTCYQPVPDVTRPALLPARTTRTGPYELAAARPAAAADGRRRSTS